MDIVALPLDTPALVPPPGVKPNFDDPANIQGRVYGISIFCLIISTCLVWARLYTRYFIHKSHGWDDYTSFVAWAGFVGYIALGLASCKYGTGIHQWDVRVHDFVTWAKLANIIGIYYIPLIYISKLSILLQYMKLFVPTRSGKTYWAIHFLIWANLLFYLSIMLAEIFACLSNSTGLDPAMSQQRHCMDLSVVLVAGATINVISDFAILILPIGKIWQLHMSPKRKLGVIAVFSAGLFACISSILRLVESVKFTRADDVTFRLMGVALWAMAEVASALVCGCLPVLPLFFRRYVPMMRNSLSANLRRIRHSRSNDSPKSTGAGTDSSGQALVRNNYVELYAHCQHKEGEGRVKEEGNQGPRYGMKRSAEERLYDMGEETSTERSVTSV